MTDTPNAPPPDPGDLTGGQGRPASASMAAAKLKIDTAALQPLLDKLSEIRAAAHGVAEEIDKVAKATGGAVEAAKVGGTSGRTGSWGKIPVAEKQMTGAAKDITETAQTPSRRRASGAGPLGGGTGIGTGGAFSGWRPFANRFGGPPVLIGASTAMAGAMVVGAMDTRIQRGVEYASGTDKLSVLTQQIYGLSQQQVMGQMRRPLTNYRLGAGGINSLMAFQAATGYMATSQLASSVAGISAATGYSKTTADILADQRTLLDPNVANQMFNQLGGINAYTFGGKMKDPMKLRQELVQALGLNNSLVLRGAASPGSITRARMTQAGIPQEMADELIQYAKENQTFRARGGRGMYNPASEDDRRRMGIEENLATQQQETDRLRVAREEQFMNRQYDNMTTAERLNQTQVKILGNIEDILSGAFGVRTGGAGWQKLLGRGLQIGGFALAPFTGGASLAATVAGTVMTGQGDPVEGDTNKGGTLPTYGGRISLEALKGRPDFRQLNPKMQERLLKMFQANPNVGLGEGYRSTENQRKLFLGRYRKTSKKTSIFWEGSYWEHVSGAAAAPPGRGMHEIGLAADLVGDMGWITANASKFGLKHFGGTNDEPWHVQPAELPSSRREYESSGSPWGGQRGPMEELPPGVPDVLGDSGKGVSSGGSYGIAAHSGMSIQQVIEAMRMETSGRMGASAALSAGAGVKKSGKTVSGSKTPVAISAGGTLTGEQVAQIAYAAGFRGEALVSMVAIAMRESGGVSTAHNPTNEDSYGLWQINMLGESGKLNAKAWGLNDYTDLYSPATNARVAFQLYQSWEKSRGNGLWPWGPYKGMDPLKGTDPSAARSYVQAAGYGGDPMPPERAQSMGASVHYSSAPQIYVSPVINFYGTPQSPDLQRIAREVGQLLEVQARTLEMRNA